MQATYEKAANIDRAVTDNADSIIKAKRKGYAAGDDPYKNFRDAAHMAEEEIWQTVISRMGDKFSRIKSFCKTGMTLENWHDLMNNDFPDIVNYTRILAGICWELAPEGLAPLPDPPEPSQAIRGT